MKKKYLLYHIIVLAALLLISSCANPIPPTGGPRDTEAPVIEKTKPETGTTNYSGQKFDIYFSEYIDRGSVAAAISVEPDLGFEYSLKWKKTRLTIDFKDELPDSTTIIITLGSQISDIRRNKMGSPYSLAISTGNRIDSGGLTGKILSAEDGNSMEEQTVFLYREPFDLSDRASYKAKTDTSGRYIFSYLKEGEYKALQVDDRNRNNTWDSENEKSQPFDRETITIEEETIDTLNAIYIAKRDTIAPALLGIGLLSTNRMRLRFSEGIRVEPDNSVSVLDSTGNPFSDAYLLFPSPEDPFVLFARSEIDLDENQNYKIRMKGFSDESGNPLKDNDITFNGSAQKDTTFQRIIGINTREIGLTDSLVITFAAPVTEPEILDSTVVIEGDIAFEEWPGLAAYRNKLIINPQGEWISDIDYRFEVWDPATRKRESFRPEIWDSTDYGAIELIMSGTDSLLTYKVLLEEDDGPVVMDTTMTGTLLIGDLAPLRYRLVVFRDENEDGMWNEGNAEPYAAPENYFVRYPVTIENGFTSTIRLIYN